MAEAIESGLPISLDGARTAVAVGVEAALAAGDLDAGDALVAPILARPVGEVPLYLKAHLQRYEALRAAAGQRHEGVEEGLAAAEGIFRGLGYPYWAARTQLDRAEWLAARESRGESARLASEAGATFEILRVAPMLARARALLVEGVAGSAGGPETLDADGPDENLERSEQRGDVLHETR